MEMSHLNALPSHRMALAMEEYPQLVGLPRAQDCERARSILVKGVQFSCDTITEEVEEEEPNTIEDKARHFFLQSIESLRRCTQDVSDSRRMQARLYLITCMDRQTEIQCRIETILREMSG